MTYLDELAERRKTQSQQSLRTQELKQTTKSIEDGSKSIVHEVARQGAKSRLTTHKVEVTNTPKIEVKHTNDYSPLLGALKQLQTAVDKLPKNIIIPEVKAPDSIRVSNFKDYSKQLSDVIKAVQGIEVQPQVSVSVPEIVVPETTIDMSGISKKLDDVVKSLKTNKPEKLSTKSLEDAIKSVKKTIEGLSFPVPNYVLPFKDSSGKAVQALVDSSGLIQTGESNGSTSTTSQVSDSATVVTLKAANTSRVKVVVVNTSTAILYVKEGSGATTSDWSYRLEQYDQLIIDDYTGIVTGIWASDASGGANVTETV